MFGSKIVGDSGALLLETDGLPYVLAGTVDVAAVPAASAARQGQFRFRDTRTEVSEMSQVRNTLINAGRVVSGAIVQSPNLTVDDYAIFNSATEYLLPLFFFRPNSFGAQFTAAQTYLTGVVDNSLGFPRRTMQVKFKSTVAGKMRVYVPKWKNLANAGMTFDSLGTSTPPPIVFSNWQPVSVDNSTHGMVTRNDSNQVVFDSRNYPLFLTRLNTTGSGAWNYGAMGRVPWVLVNGGTNPRFDQFFTVTASNTPLVYNLPSDGILTRGAAGFFPMALI